MSNNFHISRKLTTCSNPFSGQPSTLQLRLFRKKQCTIFCCWLLFLMSRTLNCAGKNNGLGIESVFILRARPEDFHKPLRMKQPPNYLCLLFAPTNGFSMASPHRKQTWKLCLVCRCDTIYIECPLCRAVGIKTDQREI